MLSCHGEGQHYLSSTVVEEAVLNNVRFGVVTVVMLKIKVF
jgi:hypothetical protein